MYIKKRDKFKMSFVFNNDQLQEINEIFDEYTSKGKKYRVITIQQYENDKKIQKKNKDNCSNFCSNKNQIKYTNEELDYIYDILKYWKNLKVCKNKKYIDIILDICKYNIELNNLPKPPNNFFNEDYINDLKKIEFIAEIENSNIYNKVKETNYDFENFNIDEEYETANEEIDDNEKVNDFFAEIENSNIRGKVWDTSEKIQWIEEEMEKLTDWYKAGYDDYDHYYADNYIKIEKKNHKTKTLDYYYAIYQANCSYCRKLEIDDRILMHTKKHPNKFYATVIGFKDKWVELITDCNNKVKIYYDKYDELIDKYPDDIVDRIY